MNNDPGAVDDRLKPAGAKFIQGAADKSDD
jgi:hypothetical protein